MSYQPQFTVTPGLLARAEQIAALRERILAGAVGELDASFAKGCAHAQHTFFDGD